MFLHLQSKIKRSAFKLWLYGEAQWILGLLLFVMERFAAKCHNLIEGQGKRRRLQTEEGIKDQSSQQSRQFLLNLWVFK